MPVRGGDDVVREIDERALNEAVTIVRRARTSGQPTTLFVPLSRATLADKSASEQIIALLDANLVVAGALVFAISESDWKVLGPVGRARRERSSKREDVFLSEGCSLAPPGLFGAVGTGGYHRPGHTTQFIDNPTELTDFHTSDVNDYIGRFGIQLIIEDIRTEQQILSVLEDGVGLAIGPHIARPAPVRSDLLVKPETEPAAGQRASATWRGPSGSSLPSTDLRLEGLSQMAARYDALICDIWGVVHNGIAGIPGGG